MTPRPSPRKARLFCLTLAAAAGLAIGFVGRILAAPPQERFDQAVRQDFFMGFAGNANALERAMKATEERLAENPKHAEALVWHGAGLYFQSGAAFRAGDAAKGMELSARGLREMEEAVALAPDNLGVRIPRGATLLTASRFIPNPQITRPLIQTGLSDYERALEIQTPFFDKIGTHPRGELLFGLAEGWSRLGNETKARAYFERITKELPETEYEKRAQIWLSGKPLAANQVSCVGCHVPAK